jgi:hypothetical protein
MSMSSSAPAMSLTKISGTVALNGVGVPGLFVWLDKSNSGNASLATIWTITGADGSFLLQSLFAVSNMQPVRLVLPPAYAQVSPAGGLGVHLTVAGGGAGTANFQIQANVERPTSNVQLPTNNDAPAAGSPLSIIFGTNPALANMPQAVTAMAAMNHFGMKVARFWTDGPMTSPPPASLWEQPLAFAAAGFQNVAVLNFQNSPDRCNVPPAEVWAAYLNAIPSPARTGVTFLEIGNEIDFSAYFDDTAGNYAELLHEAATILRAKGYKIICANMLFGMSWLTELAALGAMADCDFVGRHAYENNAAAALADYQALIAFAQANGKGVFCTEVGLHGNAGNLPQWAAETQKLYAGVKALNATPNTQRSTLFIQAPAYFLQFPLFPSGTTASPQSLLLANGQPNQPFYSAAEAALGVNQ